MKKTNLLAFAVLMAASTAVGKQVETYSATENDGTPKVIRATTPTLGNTMVIHLAREDRVAPPAERQRERAKELERERAAAAQSIAVKEVSEADLRDESQALDEASARAESESNQSESEIDSILDEPAQKSDSPVTAEAAQPADKNVDLRLDEKRDITEKARAEAAKKAELLAKKLKFDEVPKNHSKEIELRVKYTYEILRRYGRAYDYRVLTSRELKNLLASLEKTSN
ncbi:MAG TPA: hypothetical protein PLH57_11695 [Oligoflexia bacterium]|nr:hypothetical protein [Oligoflexia bacterium]